MAGRRWPSHPGGGSERTGLSPGRRTTASRHWWRRRPPSGGGVDTLGHHAHRHQPATGALGELADPVRGTGSSDSTTVGASPVIVVNNFAYARAAV